jgi:hypothetical protein
VPTISGQLDSSLLAEVYAKDPHLAQVLDTIISGVNTLARNTGTSPTGDVAPPKPPDSVSVKVAGEMMHVSIDHGGQVERGIHYFTEVHTSPAFDQPVVQHNGASRTSLPHSLPTYLDDGITKAKYYVRVVAQNPGGPPSPPYIVGGASNPTAFQMSGSTAMTLLPSHGSGTAPNTGQSAGQGLGRFQMRQK